MMGVHSQSVCEWVSHVRAYEVCGVASLRLSAVQRCVRQQHRSAPVEGGGIFISREMKCSTDNA